MNEFIKLIFGHGQSFVGAIPLDALLNETVALNSNVTTYAVEEGAPINDHIGQESEKLSISGVVTAARVTLWGPSGLEKMVSAKEELRRIHAMGQEVSIVTGIDAYQGYAMESCSIKRDSGSGMKFSVELGFVKIRKAVTREVDIPPETVNAMADKGKAKGKCGGTKVNCGRAKQSRASCQKGCQPPSVPRRK